MELSQISNGTKVYGADDTYSLIAGQQLKFEAGEDEFNKVVPEGKRWTINISMKVVEEDL